MSLQSSLYTLLSGGGTSAGNRFYPVTAPDDVTAPYGTFQRIAVVPETVMAGKTGLMNTRLQLDLYAKDYPGVIALQAQVETLLEGWTIKTVQLSAQDFYEPDVKLHRVLLDYSIWHT